MERSQVKWGALLSYILIVINSLYGLIIVPYILGTIGASEYGVYKSIGSITATISVMELGLGGTMQRFIAKHRAQHNTEGCYNFSAMCMLQACILSVAMAAVGTALFFTIEPTYQSAFTALEIVRAKQIYIVMIIYVVFHIFENVFWGIIAGYNRFIFSNSIKLITLLVRVALYFVVLPIFKNSLAIVLITLTNEFVVIAVEYFYIKRVLHHKIKLYAWDKAEFKESFYYTVALFVQSLIIQFNGNVDNIVIGAVIGTSAVTLYSFAIQIFNMYEQCATSISSVILPSITNAIYKGATAKDLEGFVIRYGRIQWAILGAALGGFLCLGQEFIGLWLGEDFGDCYYLALILMIPVTFPLIANTCLAILKAKNLLSFRTISLAYSAILNLILTVFGTQIWGYWAAALGTAISTIIGSIVSLNIYYYAKLKMNMLRVYFKILHKIALCIALPCLACFALNCVFAGSWTSFLVKAGIFIAIYGILLLWFGLDANEKSKLLRK